MTQANALRWEEWIAPEEIRGSAAVHFKLLAGSRLLAILYVPRLDEVVGHPPPPDTTGVRWRRATGRIVTREGPKPCRTLEGVVLGGDEEGVVYLGPEIAHLAPLNDAAWDELAGQQFPAIGAGPLQISFPPFPNVPKAER